MQRNGDAPRIEPTGGDLGEQRAVTQMIRRADQCQVGRTLRQQAFECASREVTREPTSDDDDGRTAHQRLSQVCGQRLKLLSDRRWLPEVAGRRWDEGRGGII